MSHLGSSRARTNRALDDDGTDPSHKTLLDESDFDADQRKWYEAPDRWYWARKSHDEQHPWQLTAVPYSSTWFAAPRSQVTRAAWDEVNLRWWKEQLHELQYQKALTAIPKPNPPLWQMHELDGRVSELRLSFRNSWTFVQNFPIMCPLDKILSLWLGIHTGRLKFERAFAKMVLGAPVSAFAHAHDEKDVTASIPTALAWFPDAFRLFRILYNIEYLDHLRELGSHKALLEYVESFRFVHRTQQLRQVRQEIEAARQPPVCELEEAIEPHLVDFLLATHKLDRYRRASVSTTTSTVSPTSERAPEDPVSQEEPLARNSRDEEGEDHHHDSDDAGLTALPPIPPHVRDELAATRFRPTTRSSNDAGSIKSVLKRARRTFGSSSSRKDDV
ncbi:hypothetical protein JCM10450v2_005001 [Rhodotorula kratochvilovae]